MIYHFEEGSQECRIEFRDRTILLTVINEAVCRVTALNRGEQKPQRSAAIEGDKQKQTAIRIQKEETGIRLFTDKIQIAVEEDGRIGFFEREGRFLTGYLSEGEESGSCGEELTEQQKAFIGREGHETADVAENAVSVKMTLDEADCIYGLGDKTGVLNKREYEYEMWNTDNPAPHEDNFKALYKSVPFMMVLKEQGAYGLFFDNTEKSVFNLGKENTKYFTYHAVGGSLDYYFMTGDDLADIIGEYTGLTGRVPMPMLWTLGYHQSRWSYMNEGEVRELAENMKKYEIPCDCIHLDIDYMEQYKVFTWNRDSFSEPERMIEDLGRQGMKIVTIVDPGVKKEEGYSVFDEGVEKKYFATDGQGNLYVNEVWPGDAVYPDFGRIEVREWWGRQHKALLEKGVSGIWNDMNEPASFNGPLPDDVVFYDEETPSCHKTMHNVYGHYMSKATYEGLQKLDDRRPFVITRACYSGTQKYAVVWTGDNNSLWTHLRMAIPQLCNLGMSGFAFAGTDVGGFGSDVTSELLVRWYQVGCFSTLFRNHSAMGTRRQEPWLFGDESLRIIRKYIRLRYELLPYFYDLFYEHQKTGLPVMRPLVLEYSRDKNTHNLNDEFMVGSNLLVSPVVEQGQVKKLVYLPEGTWYDYWTKERIEGGGWIVADAPLDICPLYVKAGAVLPKYPVRSHIDESKDEKLILEVYPGEGTYYHYQDNGTDFAYEKGEYNLYRIVNSGNGDVKMETEHQGYREYGEIEIISVK